MVKFAAKNFDKIGRTYKSSVTFLSKNGRSHAPPFLAWTIKEPSLLGAYTWT